MTRPSVPPAPALGEAGALTTGARRPACLPRSNGTDPAPCTRLREQFLARRASPRPTIDVVGFHGQTVLHAPERGLTVQLGDGAALRAAIGIDVVYDLRARRCGGRRAGRAAGAVYHRALARDLPSGRWR